MAKDLTGPFGAASAPGSIYFAVLLDETRRRALWIRQTMFVPKEGEGRATIWGAWFDKDATPRTVASKRYAPLDHAKLGDSEELIRIDDSWMTRAGATGRVDNLRWQARWSGGKATRDEVPAWIPAPTHARDLLHDADMEATVDTRGESIAIHGRAVMMHLWGRRRVPTLHWIWTPWLGDGSLEVGAVSLRDRFALGLSLLTLDGPTSLTGVPATAAHPHGLLTATVAGARRLVHSRAWAEPDELVGYAYRDTDDRDLMVAQSDIGSAHYEQFVRKAPGAPWRLGDERRIAGGVAVEIHQRLPLPGVTYLPWDDTKPTPLRPLPLVRRSDHVEWPVVTAIVALGLTYADHVKETGQKLEAGTPPVAFTKHSGTLVIGDAQVLVPTSEVLLAALAAVEPGLDEEVRQRIPIVPAVMDYEGELAVVALGDIDDERLAAGIAQPLGLVVCNDLTARICQVFGEGMPQPYDYWACAKSFPRFLPVAERVWAPDGGLAKLPELTLITRVNGEERQHSSTKNLIYDLGAIVRAARMHLDRRLVRGDVILTGTPAGIGMRLNPVKRRIAQLVKDRFRKAELLVSSYATSNALLRPGDVVEVEAGPAGSVRARLIV